MTDKQDKSERKTVVVLLEGDTSSIEYEGDETCEIYKVTNLFEYKSYVTSKITQRLSHISILVKFTTVEGLTKTMHFLSQFNSKHQEELQVSKSKFTQQVEKFTRKLQPETSELPTTLSQGQCELSMCFPVSVLFDSSQIKDNELSPTTIFNLQITRYIMLKHGCGDIISFDSSDSWSDISTVDLEDTPPKPIFSSDGQIVYYIPQGWDSWNKIILQGKSIISSITSDLIIREEAKLFQFDSKYEEYFTGNITINELFSEFNYKPTTTTTSTAKPDHLNQANISYNQFLQEIAAPSIVES
ncbi:hypothetical protein JA1_003082 [Spathaspora sp. JA1]|nr:hypothetical protein JA1_003082 [Spathaspora sp. JA1]